VALLNDAEDVRRQSKRLLFEVGTGISFADGQVKRRRRTDLSSHDRANVLSVPLVIPPCKSPSLNDGDKNKDEWRKPQYPSQAQMGLQREEEADHANHRDAVDGADAVAVHPAVPVPAPADGQRRVDDAVATGGRSSQLTTDNDRDSTENDNLPSSPDPPSTFCLTP